MFKIKKELLYLYLIRLNIYYMHINYLFFIIFTYKNYSHKFLK